VQGLAAVVDRLVVVGALDQVLADVPWWSYLQVWVRPDGTAFVTDDHADRVESFPSEGAAIAWAVEKAKELLANEVMTT